MKPLIRTIPTTYDGQNVIGWARTDTSDSGRYWSGGYSYTDIRLKLEDGTSRYVTLEERGPMMEPWPMCEEHWQAQGACMPCYHRDRIWDRCPAWVHKIHVAMLTSIIQGHANLAAIQARTVAHAVRYHAAQLESEDAR